MKDSRFYGCLECPKGWERSDGIVAKLELIVNRWIEELRHV
jgi:hypothetical protein